MPFIICLLVLFISHIICGPYWMIHPLLVVNLERKWMDQEMASISEIYKLRTLIMQYF
jgi:hypothetical protein